MTAKRADLVLHNPDGSVAVSEAMSVVFYARTPHLAMRDPVAHSIRAFAALVGFTALNIYGDEDGEDQALDAAALEALLHERFYAPGHFQNATVELSGSDPHGHPYRLSYGGTAGANPELPEKASSLWCQVPRRFFLEHRAEFLAFADATSARMPFTSGYISPSLAGEDRHGKQVLGARYAGVDLALPPAVSRNIGDHCAGAYWVNYLGSALAKRLGGPEGLRAALPEGVVVASLPGGGARVTLTPEPELGDRNRNHRLPTHQAFARLLDGARELTIPQRVVYFVDADHAADRDAMEAWHRRFLDAHP